VYRREHANGAQLCTSTAIAPLAGPHPVSPLFCARHAHPRREVLLYCVFQGYFRAI